MSAGVVQIAAERVRIRAYQTDKHDQVAEEPLAGEAHERVHCESALVEQSRSTSILTSAIITSTLTRSLAAQVATAVELHVLAEKL
jgi:hypothetical protein